MRRLDLLPSMPFFPTASELPRAAECVAPWALGLPESEDEPGEWAERGRYQHELAEDLVNESQHVPDLGLYSVAIAHLLKDAIDADRRAAKCIVWPDRIRVTVRSEVGAKWRSDGFYDEAELCERAPGERLRGWFSGTADLVYVRRDGVLVVADWKFGAMEHLREPAEESCQGFFLALAFCRLLEITGSSADVVVARFEKRIVSENGIEVDGYDITQGELLQWHNMLAGLAGRIVKAESAAPRISAACGHCKAKAECPSWNQLETSAVVAFANPSSDEFISLCRMPETDEDARLMHHAIKAGEGVVKEWKRLREVYILAHADGLVVGLGLKLKAIPSKDREILDTPEGLDAIERIVPGSIIVQRKATLPSIAKAAREAVDGIASTSDRKKTKDAKEKDAFALLIEAGAVIDKGKKLSVCTVRSDEKDW